MDPSTLLDSLSALVLGLAAILAAHRLERVHRHRFLGDYVMFLVLSALWGFALWIVPALLSASGPAAGASGLRGFPMVSKWFGFPFHLLQLYFLVLLLSGLLERPVSNLFRRAYLGGAAGALVVLFVALVDMLRGGNKDVFDALHAWITRAYLALQALIFAWAGLRARQARGPDRRRAVGGFALLYLAGFGAYYLLTSWATRSVVASAWIFAAYHWPPLAWLALALRRGWIVAPPAASPEAVSAWLGPFDLTEREQEIVGRLLDGQSNRQIADELFLSHQTVKNYVSRVYRKLNVSSRVELIVALRRAQDGTS